MTFIICYGWFDLEHINILKEMLRYIDTNIREKLGVEKLADGAALKSQASGRNTLMAESVKNYSMKIM